MNLCNTFIEDNNIRQQNNIRRYFCLWNECGMWTDKKLSCVFVNDVKKVENNNPFKMEKRKEVSINNKLDVNGALKMESEKRYKRSGWVE